MRRPTVLFALSLLSLALAGCIDVTGDETDDSGQGPAPATDGTMTATERKEEDVAPCTSGGVGFCATRTVIVEGTIGGFSLLEVDLSTFNGHVKVVPSREGEWGFQAKLQGRAATPDQARSARDDIQFTWSHEGAGGHFLHVKADYEGRGDDAGRSAQLDVTLPPGLTLRLVARTVNGPVEVKDLRTDGLSASSVNGGVDVKAHVTQAELSTTNGAVDAELTPTASGRIRASTTNGEISLKVPEDASRGYDVTGATTNGEVDITLRDGTVGPCPQGSQYYTPPCNRRTFTTNSYGSRSIQTSVTASTTNGAVDVAPL